VPNDNELNSIRVFLAASGDAIAGGKMKSVGTQYWLAPNVVSNNSTGWSGLPSGARYYSGSFSGIGTSGGWWSTSERLLQAFPNPVSTTNTTNNEGWIISLQNNEGSAYRLSSSKVNGYSVRCLKD
jgi:uncharacterized protein (TIGR02145 family)